MACPSCGQRKARRDCPAIGASICTVCCGTKRLTEIACPPTCSYLAVAREHPAAVVKRQQEKDVAVLLPTISHLTERQHQLFFIFHTAMARHTPEGFARLRDEDVADAAAAVAATLETAAKGVIYEHPAQSLVAQRLSQDLKAVLEEARRHGATIYDREAAIALRAIEQGARATQTITREGPTAYLQLVGRLLETNRAAAQASQRDSPPKATSPIILP